MCHCDPLFIGFEAEDHLSIVFGSSFEKRLGVKIAQVPRSWMGFL